jgi:serine/threonine protein kinase
LTDPQWEQLKGIVADALDREPARRAAFLDSACGGDVELRRQAEALLEIEDDADSYFEATTQSAAPVPGTDEVSRTIGRYTTRRVIASGGMGTIYEAVQDRPRRQVALKVLRHGAASSTALKRFRHEAEILGRLRHPNIAQIHDAGTFDEGAGVQPYFAMELVKGRPLIAYCEAAELGTHDRLNLFTKVCNAVQYAHYQGVIHRDLKPDNILVDDFGDPKVLDFGVARATDSDIQLTTVKTDIGQLIGTVPYMSPEQVTGDPADVDTRSDVYSLGVVLYELLVPTPYV